MEYDWLGPERSGGWGGRERIWALESIGGGDELGADWGKRATG